MGPTTFFRGTSAGPFSCKSTFLYWDFCKKAWKVLSRKNFWEESEAVGCKQGKQWAASKWSSGAQAREAQHFCSNLKDFGLNLNFCLNLKDFCSNLNFCSNLKDFGLKPKKKAVYKNRKSCGFHNSQTSFASRNLLSHNKTETSTQISLNLVNKNIIF